MNKELKVIDFYCKKCKKSIKNSYMVTGNRNYPVLPRVMMKCHHCGRVMTLKNFKEGELLDKVEQDKYYIIQEGESLSSIAFTRYGDADLAAKIAEANDIGIDDNIFVGQKILLPNLQ